MKVLPQNERLISAGRLAGRTFTHARLWWSIAGVPGRARHRDVIDEYWEMLRFTENAHLISFIVGVHALHHERAGTVNFHSLSKELGGAASNAITAGMDVHKKIEILRHQAFAHKTDKRTYDDVFVTAGIAGDEILDHASLTLGIANELLRSGGLPEVSMHDLPEQTASQMFSNLRRSNIT